MCASVRWSTVANAPDGAGTPARCLPVKVGVPREPRSPRGSQRLSSWPPRLASAMTYPAGHLIGRLVTRSEGARWHSWV